MSGDSQRDDPRAFGYHFRDAQAVSQRVQGRTEDPKGNEQADRAEIQRAPVIGRDAIQHELVSGRNLMEPGQCDARIGEQVHGVPPLVPKPAPDDHDGGHDDGDQQGGSDGRRDHSGVDATAEHGADLFRQGDPVHQGVAPDGEDDVREHEVEARVTVPAVPDGQAVEAEEPLDRGQACEEEHLQERGVGAQKPGDPGETGQERSGAEVVREVAAVDPEPDHHRRVAGNERPDQGRRRQPAALARRARADRRGDSRA